MRVAVPPRPHGGSLRPAGGEAATLAAWRRSRTTRHSPGTRTSWPSAQEKALRAAGRDRENPPVSPGTGIGIGHAVWVSRPWMANGRARAGAAAGARGRA